MTRMMRRTALAVCALGVLCVGLAKSAGEQPTPQIPPPDNPKRTSWSSREWPIEVVGTVTEVTDHSISIRPDKKEEVVCFPAHTALAGGGSMKDAEGGASYRLRDVKVGDHVCVGAVKEENGVTYGIGIFIGKRPGGRLPPCPNWPYKTSACHAEYRNAIDDLEELGQPLPEKVRRGMSSDEPEAKKSDAIKAALKPKVNPPDKIEKAKD